MSLKRVFKSGVENTFYRIPARPNHSQLKFMLTLGVAFAIVPPLYLMGKKKMSLMSLQKIKHSSGHITGKRGSFCG